MKPIRIDLGYRNDENQNTFFNFRIDSNTPFTLFDLNWRFKFDTFYEYQSDKFKMSYGFNQIVPVEQHYLKNTTGLSVELPILTTTFTIGFNESFIVNEENTAYNIIVYNLNNQYQEGLYMSSNPYISWKIPLGLEIYNWGELTYTPNAGVIINHEVSSPLAVTRKGPFFNFGHYLGFGKSDWIGNFQKVFSVSANNSYIYNYYLRDDDPWNGILSVNLIAKNTADDIMGISTRLMYRQWLFSKYGLAEGAGDTLRGIKDDSVTFVKYMYSLNVDVTAKIFSFRASELFNNTKMRVFNFDVHASPFLDVAIYESLYNEIMYKDADFTYKNLLTSGGLELIFYPSFMRSLLLRASIGFNFLGRPNSTYYELFIGTELHY